MQFGVNMCIFNIYPVLNVVEGSPGQVLRMCGHLGQKNLPFLVR